MPIINNVETAQLTQYPTSSYMLVEAADLTNDNTSATSLTQELGLILSGQPNLPPMINGLQYTSTSTVISVTSDYQLLVVGSQICDTYDIAGSPTMPATVAPSTSVRTDAIYVAYSPLTVNSGETRSTRNTDGSISTIPLNYSVNGYRLTYITGTNGSTTVPAGPSGYYLHAVVSVTTAGVTGITYQFPTLQMAITGSNSTPSLNGINGPVTIAGGSGISVTESGSTVTVSATGTGVTSLNGENGAITINAESGMDLTAVGNEIYLNGYSFINSDTASVNIGSATTGLGHPVPTATVNVQAQAVCYFVQGQSSTTAAETFDLVMPAVNMVSIAVYTICSEGAQLSGVTYGALQTTVGGPYISTAFAFGATGDVRTLRRACILSVGQVPRITGTIAQDSAARNYSATIELYPQITYASGLGG